MKENLIIWLIFSLTMIYASVLLYYHGKEDIYDMKLFYIVTPMMAIPQLILFIIILLGGFA